MLFTVHVFCFSSGQHKSRAQKTISGVTLKDLIRFGEIKPWGKEINLFLEDMRDGIFNNSEAKKN